MNKSAMVLYLNGTGKIIPCDEKVCTFSCRLFFCRNTGKTAKFSHAKFITDIF